MNVLKLDNITKDYLVATGDGGAFKESLLRNALSDAVRHRFSKVGAKGGAEGKVFRALDGVSFELNRGDVLGVLGRNGAGKSTLLKILSRITKPTSGNIRMRGQLASLLEVGTGFHPELSGRENVFLNGAILGMNRSEMKRKFDEIVDFAGVERFIDLPVKRYSSGMYVRLAFSVAAHLEPDILIVDEVLAVGDADFQKKSIGKMKDVAKNDGRTILFVSHNLAAIAELCNKGVLLNKGRLTANGPIGEVMAEYLKESNSNTAYKSHQTPDAGEPFIASIDVVTSEGRGVQQFGKAMQIEITINHETPLKAGCLSVSIADQFTRAAIHLRAYSPEVPFGAIPGKTVIRCELPEIRLNVGTYQVSANLSEPPGGNVYERLDSVCMFEVIRPDKNVYWGWHPEASVYEERHHWTVRS